MLSKWHLSLTQALKGLLWPLLAYATLFRTYINVLRLFQILPSWSSLSRF